jgi:hypothetical protein
VTDPALQPIINAAAHAADAADTAALAISTVVTAADAQALVAEAQDVAAQWSAVADLLAAFTPTMPALLAGSVVAPSPTVVRLSVTTNETVTSVTFSEGSTVVGLAAPDPATLIATVTLQGVSPGDHDYTVVGADSEGDPTMPLDLRVTVTAPPPPPALTDLVVTNPVILRGGNPLPPNTNPVAGNLLTFQGTVTNQGGTATPAGVIVGMGAAVDGTDANAPAYLWADQDTSPLPPGTSVVLATNGGRGGITTWTATPGRHSLRLIVDDVNRIVEGNEANNFIDLTFTVDPKPSPFPIAVHPSGRYLTDASGAPYFPIADAMQGCYISQVPLAQMPALLAQRTAGGINAIYIDLLSSAYVGGVANGSAFLPADGGPLVPFYKADGVTLGTGWGDYDPSKPVEAYWHLVDQYLAVILAAGLAVLANPAETGGNSPGPFILPMLRRAGLTKCAAYGAFLAARYSQAGVGWFMGNDFVTAASGATYVGADGKAATDNQLVLAVAQTIRAANPAQQMTVQLERNGVFPVNDNAREIAAWANLITVTQTYAYVPAWAPAFAEWNNATPRPMPVLLGETGYVDAKTSNPYGGSGTPFEVRCQNLLHLTAGGLGGLTWATWVGTGGLAAQIKTPTVTVQQSLRELGYLRALLGRVAWWKLVPDAQNTFRTGGMGTFDATIGYSPAHPNLSPEQGTGRPAVLASDGTLGLVYVPHADNPAAGPTLNLAKLSGPLNIAWWDPTTGTSTYDPATPGAGKTIPNVGSKTVAVPTAVHADGARDWLLVVTVP